MRSEGYVPDANASSTATSSPSPRRKGRGKHLIFLRRSPLWGTDGPDKTVIRELLDQIRAEPGCSNKFEQNALFLTIRFRRQAFVQVLLDHDRVNPNVPNKDGFFPLHAAARAGEGTIVKVLLDDDRVDPNVRDQNGCSPLHVAIREGKETAVKILLDDARVDTNIADRIGSSPLHMAIRGGKDAIVKVLLDDHRVDPNITDKFGRTPLHLAAYMETEPMVEVLLRDTRVNPIPKDDGGRTPLFYALERGFQPSGKSRAPIIKRLLSAIKGDAGFTDEESLLSRAAQQGDEEVVRALLDDERIDPESADSFGLTPLMWTKAGGTHLNATTMAKQPRRWFNSWGDEARQSIVDMLLGGNGAIERPRVDSRLQMAGQCLRFWMSACDDKHDGACCAKPVEKRLPREIPNWVIDVSRGCIVPGHQVPRYAALSYVWDTSKRDKRNPIGMSPHRYGDFERHELHYDERLLLKRENVSDFQMPGHLHGPITDRIPAVIRDTMALLNSLGERYVWIDCLCIVQDDESTREQVDHMHEVYLGAHLTIIAATYAGLFTRSRVPGTRRSDWEVLWDNWGPGRRIEELYRQVLATKWATRGWTFQEQIMSKRAVVFLEGEIFWDCQHAVWDQNQLLPRKVDEDFLAPHYGTAHRMFKTAWPDFRTYLELIGLYNDRDFTYPQDALPAVSGILTNLTHSFQHGFIGGLPRLFLHEALLWQPFSRASRREADWGGSIPINGHLPSWSWCGWRCPVDPFSVRTGQAYLNDEESRARVSSWHTSLIAQWSAISEDLRHEEEIHGPATLSKYGDSQGTAETALPSGWSRCTNSDTTAGNSCSDPTFVHESDLKTRFRRPVPIRDTEHLDPPVQNNWPFLSCVTTGASCRIASVLKPYRYVRPRPIDENMSMGSMVSIYRLPLFTYAHGPQVNDICHVICLEDAQGSFAGLLRRMDDRPVTPGEEIELMAISAGSVDYADLQFTFEDNVHRKQECSYPSGNVPFWRVLPGKESESINRREWAPGNILNQ